MYVLGIETSCDETSAAVVEDGRSVLSNVVTSSLAIHKKYGGVIPEIAFRKQLETIAQVTDCAIKEAGIRLKDIKLVSVTSGPGLLGSLLVGISFAKGLSLSLKVPLLGVDHIYSHIYANFLNCSGVKMPFVALVISGGHTSLFNIKDFARIKVLGSTQDDACGEAFDKVARILQLGYPGGPLIERLSKKGNPRSIRFSCSNTEKPLNFSFSGIKTAVLYYVKKNCDLQKKRASNAEFEASSTADIAASFQEAVIDTLIKKSLLACKFKKVKRLVVGGGVAANNKLRGIFHQETAKAGIKCYFPPIALCMDNAAMVAGLGYQLFKRGDVSDLGLAAQLD